MKYKLLPAAMALCGLALPSIADAAILPSAEYSQGYYLKGSLTGLQTAPGSYSYSILGGTDQIKVQADPTNNAVSTSQTTSPAGVVTGTGLQSFANMSYYYEFTGPAAAAIPVIFDFSMRVSGTGNYVAFDDLTTGAYDSVEDELSSISLGVELCDEAPAALGFCTAQPGRQEIVGTSYAQSVVVYLQPNTVYQMNLGASVAFFQNPTYLDIGTASLDPFIGIDPNFANAGLYSLSFSAGVSNGAALAAVPEPATFGIFGAGLVGLGGCIVLRRRRKLACGLN